MKKTKQLLTIALLAIMLSAGHHAHSQVEMENALRSGANDGELYLENYLRPAFLSFGNGLANGWYNTAKTHKLLGFDITASVNLATIPEEAYTFSYGDPGRWENLILVSGDGRLPTLAGDQTNSQLALSASAQITDPRTGNSIEYTDETDPFDAAPGIDAESIPFAGIPTPTVNAGLGLVKNTDLMIRYTPEIETDDFAMSTFGVGVRHDIKQWIPGLKLVPVDIAAFIGTTNMDVKINYTFDGSDFQTIRESDMGDPNAELAPGSTEFNINSTTIQILASKKLAILTPYAGIGYNIINSDVDVKGVYRYYNDNDDFVDLKDPASLSFDEGSSARFTVGARLKLLILTIHADYTIQKYNSFTAGVGISVR